MFLPLPFSNRKKTNQDIVRRFFDAYARQDADELRKVMHEQVVWTFPGKHPLSGTKKGINEVVSFFKKMEKFGLKGQPLIASDNEDFFLECHRVWSDPSGSNQIDILWCVLWKIENGKIIEGRHFSADQELSDRFFNQSFS